MTQAKLILRILALAAVLASIAQADAQEELEFADVQNPLSPPGSVRGSGYLPLEDILRALTNSFGFSFVFDSRIIKGKYISPIDNLARPAEGLEARLRSVDLSLQRINARTYAITMTAAAPVVAPPPAPALQASLIDTIVVTSMASSSSGVVEASRIFDLDEVDLSHLNAFEPSEAIYALPQSLATFTPANSARHGASAGLSLVDLRGFGPERTLVMVNGRAPTMAPGGNDTIVGVDLNSIAEPFLEFIEVETTPGGARYGAQAAAGAVNFKLRSGLDGGQAGARFGISERGDAEEASLYFVGGRYFRNDSINLSGGINLTRREGLIGADRETTAIPYGFGLNGVMSYAPGAMFLPGYGASSTTDRGAISAVLLTNDEIAPPLEDEYLIPNPDGTVSPYIGALDQLYNWVAEQNTVLPADRGLAYFTLSADVAAEVRLFAESFGGVTESEGRIAPLPATRFAGVDPLTGDAAVIPLDNPTVPGPIRQLIFDEYGASAKAILFDHRYKELGHRRQNVRRKYVDFRAGVDFGTSVDRLLTLSYRYGLSGATERQVKRIDRDKLLTALDVDVCVATPECALADFFNPDGLSAETINFISAPELRRKVSLTEHEVTAHFRKSIDAGLPEIGSFHAGIELKRAMLADRDLTPSGMALIGSYSTNDVHRSLETADAFGGVELPLLRRKGFPGSLDASIISRIAISSAYAAAPNFEGALTWRPVEGVALFTRQHVGRRTPNIIELFNIGQSTEHTLTDPCASGGKPLEPNVAANCASGAPFGVPPGYDQVSYLARYTFFGNPDLESENVHTRVFGLAITPTDMIEVAPGRLEIAANWLDYRIKNAITGQNDPVNDCFASLDLSSPACALNPRTGNPGIVRDPSSGKVVAVEALLSNSGEFAWRGLDTELHYTLEPAGLGPIDRLWLNGVHSFAERVVHSAQAGIPIKLDGLVQFPRHRSLISAGVEAGPFDFAAFVHRRGKVITRRTQEPAAQISAITYIDVSLRYALDNGALVQVGVENATNREPPIAAFSDLANTYPQYYDIAGRRYSVSVHMKF